MLPAPAAVLPAQIFLGPAGLRARKSGYTARMTSDMLANSAWADHGSADLAAARAEADRLQHDTELLKAIRVIASAAHDSADAHTLLAMLGADADDIRRAVSQRTVAA